MGSEVQIYLDVEVRRVLCRNCGAVKQERLAWLADNPFYTQRFAYFVGRRCRTSTLLDVARELRLDWKTVKELDKEYMREQLQRLGTPAPKVIGIDEIAIRKGHTYRIIVSDLIRRRPIWFGGQDRSEQSLDLFFQWLGPKKSRGIRLAVMDMWKAFRTSTLKKGNAPQAAILYDKFHVVRHLGEGCWTKSAIANTPVSPERTGVSSRARNTRCRPIGSTSPRKGVNRYGYSWRPTSVSTPPTSSRNRSDNCGTTNAKAGRVGSSTTGNRPYAGNASERLREVRPHDRKPLGGDRGLLRSGKQGRSGLRRGTEQQDSRPPERDHVNHSRSGVH